MRAVSPGIGRLCCAGMLVLSLAVPAARAAGTGKADALCSQADRAEGEAREMERKSAERRRFLEGRGGSGSSAAAASEIAAAGNSAASTQAIRAQVERARALLPQIRRGIQAAGNDRGIVPGLSQYFSQMEAAIGGALQSVEMCLANPGGCAPPAIHCPAPPNIAVFNRNVNSADLIRRVQDSYRQAANETYQACRGLQVDAAREIGRLKQESRAADAAAGRGADSWKQPIGEVDLYLRRAGNLRNEAARDRKEADRISGVAGYCRSGGRAGRGTGGAGSVADALRSAGRKQTDAPGLRPDAKVVDLKAEWEKPWDGGPALKASDVPLPKAEAGPGGETMFGKVDEFLDRNVAGYGMARDYLSEKAPWWWYKAESLYREADRQVGLTEFIKSRPVELAKDVATEVVEASFGRFGKSVTTAYKITDAVKSTSDEVGEILLEAPGVLAHGSADDARRLYRKTERVPVKFAEEVFESPTKNFPSLRDKSREGQSGGGD